MAEGDYRFRIPGGVGSEPEISLNGMVRFDVFVERSFGGDLENWRQINMGHFTLQVPGSVIEQAQNAGQVLAYIEGQILNKGLAQADLARRALIALLPGGEWPTSDITRTLGL